MITLFWTVAFCLGLRIVTDGDKQTGKGQLLYFLRRPFEKMYDKIELYENKNTINPNNYYRHLIKWNYLMINISKPFIMCITCMASIWGVAVFVTLNGFNLNLLPNLILNCVSASFIQTFIWSIYAKYIQ